MVVMATVPLVSIVLLMAISTFTVLAPNTGTDLERTVIPVASFVVIYAGVGAAPSMVSIAIILYRRRIFGEPLRERGISKPAKVTVIILAVWAVFMVWVGTGANTPG